LKSKRALITGTQGLGYAMAQRFAAEGCHIVLNGPGD
jgi:3-hydroxybutyrate dehydrogenase